MIDPAHGKQQMKALPPQVDVHFVRDHTPRRLRIGDEKHVLVGRARERNAVELAYGAVRAVASGDPCGNDLATCAVGAPQRRRDLVGLLCEADELGVPLHRYAQLAQLVAHNPFVVVLAEDEDERVGGFVSSGFAQRDVRHPAPLRPDVCAAAAFAEREGAIDDAELRVDFQGACLDAERSRLQRRPGVPVDDQRPHATPR
jgi:hypothetical protein